MSILASCDIDFPNMSGPIAEKGKRREGKVTSKVTSEMKEGHLYTLPFCFPSRGGKFNARSSTVRF